MTLLRKRKRRRVLLDIDGLFANFIAGALPHVKLVTGRDHHHDEVDQWLIEKALKLDNEQTTQLYKAVASPSWCRQLPAYEGAREGLEEIRRHADVWAVTQPYPSPTWAYERDQWLVEDFGFDINDVQHVRSKAKHAVDGDIFGEDKTSTLVEWQEWHPEGVGVLFERRYNKDEGWHGLRASDWPTYTSLIVSTLLERAW
jgi:5'(3')-deoxyribonucleotidase